MEWPDVLHRIEAGEGDQTEFKRGFDLNDAGKTICAFANGGGGLLVMGVTDEGLGLCCMYSAPAKGRAVLTNK